MLQHIYRQVGSHQRQVASFGLCLFMGKYISLGFIIHWLDGLRDCCHYTSMLVPGCPSSHSWLCEKINDWGTYWFFLVCNQCHLFNYGKEEMFTSALLRDNSPAERHAFNMFHSIHEVCHEKTDLKVFVVVIPKEGWARVAAPILLLVWDRLFRFWLCWHHRLYSLKVGVIPKEGWARPCVPILLLVWQRQRP